MFLQKATHYFDYMSYLMGVRIVRDHFNGVVGSGVEFLRQGDPAPSVSFRRDHHERDRRAVHAGAVVGDT